MRQVPDIWRDFDSSIESFFRNDSMRLFPVWRPLLKQLDDMFSEVNSNLPSAFRSRMLTPNLDVEESDEHYLLSFDMPGLKKMKLTSTSKGTCW